MAAVLSQRSANTAVVEGIPRSKNQSINISSYEESSWDLYKKPTQRPQPLGIAEKSIFDVHVSGETHRQAVLCDLVWKILRQTDVNGVMPAWSGSNSLVTEADIPVATVSYLPFTHAPPSDFSTIYTILRRLIAIAFAQGQHHILVAADLAIYSKAEQILWGKNELQNKVTMRLGGMHLIMTFLASIGKLYGDGGYQACLTSSGLYAPASVQTLLA